MAFDSLTISTQTIIVNTNWLIDIANLFNKLPITPYMYIPAPRKNPRIQAKGVKIDYNLKKLPSGSIITLKYKGETRGVDIKQMKKLYSHRVSKKITEPKKKKPFRNSMMIVMKVKDKKITFKLPCYGRIQICGCKSEEHAELCVKYIWKHIYNIKKKDNAIAVTLEKYPCFTNFKPITNTKPVLIVIQNTIKEQNLSNLKINEKHTNDKTNLNCIKKYKDKINNVEVVLTDKVVTTDDGESVTTDDVKSITTDDVESVTTDDVESVTTDDVESVTTDDVESVIKIKPLFKYNPKILFITVMINIDFNLGFILDREKLNIFINKNTEYKSLLETSVNTSAIVKIQSIQSNRPPLIEFELNNKKWIKGNMKYSKYVSQLNSNEQKKEVKHKYHSFLMFHSGAIILSSPYLVEMEIVYNKFIGYIKENRKILEEKLIQDDSVPSISNLFK